MTLPGKSRTITVEPIEIPGEKRQPRRDPEPRREPAPQKAPARKPEKVPA
jgi:hypothetical protein